MSYIDDRVREAREIEAEHTRADRMAELDRQRDAMRPVSAVVTADGLMEDCAEATAYVEDEMLAGERQRHLDRQLAALAWLPDGFEIEETRAGSDRRGGEYRVIDRRGSLMRVIAKVNRRHIGRQLVQWSASLRLEEVPEARAVLAMLMLAVVDAEMRS